MSAAEPMLTYYDAVTEDFRDGARRAYDFFAVEGIHDLRVATKKMRAFLRLVEFIQPAFDAGAHTRVLKPLYGVAGQLRDIDIQQEIILDGLNRYQISEYANELKQMEFALRPALRTSIKEFRSASFAETRRGVDRALKLLTSGDKIDRIDRRLQTLVTDLAPLLGRRTATDLELHDIRKVSKASKYTLDVWQLSTKVIKESSQLSAALKDVYTHLGKWHDYRVTAERLSTFLKRETPRNLFDQTAYRKFLNELAVRETEHLRSYRAASKGLSANLKRWKPIVSARPGIVPFTEPETTANQTNKEKSTRT
ncbi:MAG: CHAD domain-containing protein [Candidatus Zixiibacteriota bacterium]